MSSRTSRSARSGRGDRASHGGPRASTVRGTRTEADEIPVARRSAAKRSVPHRPRALGWLLLVGGGGAILAALLVITPLRSPIPPPTAPAVGVRPDADGRLLGHFPYPEAPTASLIAIAPGMALRQEAARAWLAMQQAAAKDGVELRVLSAFRGVALQKQLFFDVKSDRNQDARTRARVSAPPGFSEHSTGYAVDLGDARLPATDLSESFEESPAFRWLKANANRFHFTLSFPRANPQGVSYEPWHWRFEGSTEALRLFEPAQRLAALGPRRAESAR